MPRSILLVVIAAVLLPTTPGAAAAQHANERFAADPDARAASEPSPLRPVRIAKWSALAATAGAAGLGFVAHRDADRTFERLEAACSDDRERCQQRRPDGSYLDAELERIYQDVVSLDRRARWALVGSQVGLVTSVILFIVDLGHDQSPPNIPYEPGRFRLAPRGNDGIELRFALPLPAR